MTPEIGQVNPHIAANSWTISPAVAVGVMDIPAVPWVVPSAVSAAPAEVSWEAALAQRSQEHAKAIPAGLKEIADQLLSRLRDKKKFRASRNLNHWRTMRPST